MRDPVFEELTAAIAAVEEVLKHAEIGEIVAAHFRQLPVARRTRDLVLATPGVLTSMDPHMPPALAALLLRLKQAGAETVRPPACARCGQQKALPSRSPQGRLCGPCGRRLSERFGLCDHCRNERWLLLGPAESAYCRACWARMHRDARARVVEEVRRHRRVAAEVIRTALDRMPSARDRSTRLMLELSAHGREWFADPAAGSALFGMFYDLLREGGARLPERRCGGCGTTRTLTERVDGRVSCRRCYRVAHTRACDGCGDVTNIERVLSEGRGLCQRCTNKLPDENAACVICGNHRLIAFRGPDGPVCSTCRSSSRTDTCTVCGAIAACLFHGTEKAICKACSDAASVDTCTVCGNRRQCRWAGTARAVCELCANPRTPCVSCGEVRLRHKRAEDGSGYLCWACTPQIIETCTSCGDDRIVNGRINGRPFCPLCYPRQPESFRPCTVCGTVTRLIAKKCPRCRADQMIREMVPDQLAATDSRIAAMRARWFHGSPSKVIYAFERGTVACTLISKLLIDAELRTHEYLDQAGSENQTRAVRAVLVDHGLLPPRDELLARFESWLPHALAEIPDPSERRQITRYARWRHLRQLRKNTTPTRSGQLSWRRIEIMSIIDLLAWIHTRGGTLASLTQTDLDSWLATGSRPHLHHFVRWTSQHHLTAPLTAPIPKSGGLSPRSITDEERWSLLADITADPAIPPHTKFAAGLMLMFGIRAARMVQLRATDLTVTDESVLVHLGDAPLALPAELAPFAEDAARNRTAPRMFVESIEQEWLFPGARASQHMSPDALNRRLRAAGIPPRLARTSALIALTQQLPPVVLSRLTGLEISSAIAWSNAIAANNTAYAADIIDRIGIPLPVPTSSSSMK
ncbi:hypothetical protein [Microbacterium sp. NPDC077184]|uniref:hypothetical protein n=3 Tax=Actinomycetes TaxID=1760 RepID=UPI00344AC2B7